MLASIYTMHFYSVTVGFVCQYNAALACNFYRRHFMAYSSKLVCQYGQLRLFIVLFSGHKERFLRVESAICMTSDNIVSYVYDMNICNNSVTVFIGKPASKLFETFGSESLR